MTDSEIMDMKEKIYNGLEMIMEKAEKIGKSKSEYSIDELYKMADILKDTAKGFKDLAKAHKIFSEHSIERY